MTTTNTRQAPKRYARPSLEIEYDGPSLCASGCCRYVLVVVRVCGLPPEPTIRVVTWRESHETAPVVSDGENEYETTPQHRSARGAECDPRGYFEASFLLCARTHTSETGRFRVEMISPPGGLLSEVEFCLDARQAQPVQRGKCEGFPRIQFLERIRSAEERAALAGGLPGARGASQESLFVLE